MNASIHTYMHTYKHTYSPAEPTALTPKGAIVTDPSRPFITLCLNPYTEPILQPKQGTPIIERKPYYRTTLPFKGDLITNHSGRDSSVEA